MLAATRGTWRAYPWPHRTVVFAGVLLSACRSEESAPSPARPMIVVQVPACEDPRVTPDVRLDGIDAGDAHTCVDLWECGALCWGANYAGQLGDGSFEPAPTPVWVARSLPIRQISLGNEHTCASTSDDRAHCWGANGNGELGAEAPSYGEIVEIESLTAPVKQVAAEGFSVCALLENGSVYCWGSQAYTTFPMWMPTRVEGVEGAIAVANGGTHACAITDDGSVWCWGQNSFGQLGDGMIGLGHPDARPVTGLPERAVVLALSHETSCAIISSGEVYCWGSSENAIAGNGSGEHQPTPLRVLELANVVELDVSSTHACAVLSDGDVACWGDDIFLPSPSTGTIPTPTRVPNISGAARIAAGFWYTCATTHNEEIYCWGTNGYWLGLGPGDVGFVGTPTRVEWRPALQ